MEEIKLQPPVRDLKEKLNKLLYSDIELHNVKYGHTEVEWTIHKNKDGYYYVNLNCNGEKSTINLQTKDITTAQYIIANSIRPYTRRSVAYSKYI